MKPDNQYIVDYVEQNGGDLLTPLDVPLHCTLDIDPTVYENFALENQHRATRKWIHPRPFLNDESNRQATHVNWIGYNEGHSVEYNGGVKAEENLELKALLGQDNINKLGINSELISIRLLWYNPGQILPIHFDGFEGFQRLTGHKPDVRFFVAVNSWDWGHFIQIHDKMISNWIPGDTYVIPPKIFHLSGNAGIRPKLSLTITGVWK